MLRHPQKINYKIGLFTNARNETNIKEWIAHHLIIGFDQIIIFDHKSSPPLSLTLKNFHSKVKVINGSHLDGKVKSIFMNWAIQVAKNLKLSHFIYLDADEYFILQGKWKSIHDIVSSYPFASVGFNWLMFGSNFREKEPTNMLLIDAYTKSDETMNHHIKSLVKTDCIYNNTNPHYYHLLPRFSHFAFNNNGLIEKMKEPYWQNPILKDPLVVPAYIAHYINQSEETFQRRKIDLPADDSGKKRSIGDLKSIHKDHNLIDNNFVSNTYSLAIKKFLSKERD